MKRRIIIGATGTIGRPLLAAARGGAIGLARRPERGMRAFDLLTDDLLAAVPDLGPRDVAVILAAYTDLNWIHAHPEEARALNVTATTKAVEQVFSRRARLVFLSSEQVFDGVTGGYEESAAPHPSTLYGRMKVEIEQRVVAAGGCVVRAGAQVTPRAGENCAVEKTYRALLGPTPRMAEDNLFSLTDVNELVAGVLAVAEGELSGIFHICAEPPVTRAELADRIAKASRFGQRMSFETISYAALSFPEPRPLRSWMRAERARRDLGLGLATPWAAVARKVEILDQRVGAG